MTANQAGTQSYEHWEPHDANAALRNTITRTRADLGETISELAARTDVKARAREAVAQARSRARETMRSTALSAGIRTREAARSGATSARQMLDRAMDSPASIAIGAGAGALAGLGVYALVGRRLALGSGLPFAPLRLSARFGVSRIMRRSRSGRRLRSLAQGRRR